MAAPRRKTMRRADRDEYRQYFPKLRELTLRVAQCRRAYAAHTPLVSDEVYDVMCSDLQVLENWLGIRLNLSPDRRRTNGKNGRTG